MDKTYLNKRDVFTLKAAGIMPSTPTQQERMQLRKIDRHLSQVFPVESKHVDCWVVFRDADQEQKGIAGWNLRDGLTDRTYIGILDTVLSGELTDNINTPDDYMMSTAIHELAHVMHGGHRADFSLKYKLMIEQWNEATGSDIYLTFEDLGYALSDAPTAPAG